MKKSIGLVLFFVHWKVMQKYAPTNAQYKCLGNPTAYLRTYVFFMRPYNFTEQI